MFRGLCCAGLTTVILLLSGRYGTCEVFTAMADVQALLDSERAVMTVLKDLIEAERKKLSFIENYVRQHEEMQLRLGDDLERAVSHPVNAFMLIKQLTVEWNNLRPMITAELGKAGVSEIERIRHTNRFPDEEDLRGAAEAIVRLQHTYNLEEAAVANGSFTGIPSTTTNFKSLDCFLVGVNLANLTFHDYAARWLHLAVQFAAEEEELGQTPPVKKVAMLDWLQHSVFHTGNVSRALRISQEIATIDPDFPNVKENTVFYQNSLKNLSKEEVEKMDEPAPIRKVPGGTYELLCRGEGTLAAKVLPHLRCYLETHGKPYLRLQPVKTEVAYTNPDIFVIHDVASNSQMERIKDIARRHLQRAMVVKPGTPEFEPSRIRISKSAFFREDKDPVVAQINNRIGHVTNLNIKAAEDLQLANYGIAGHYDPHYDHFRTLMDVNDTHRQTMHRDMGDRIATFLLYLSDVDAGGATVFPKINLTLYPQKGSAAFWFNLHRDGLGDDDTLHAGCPVLSGVKWISNKWIREKGQFATRPCGLQPDSPEWVDGWPSHLVL